MAEVCVSVLFTRVVRCIDILLTEGYRVKGRVNPNPNLIFLVSPNHTVPSYC